jgi:uncharacterized protein (DUF2267 family)
MSATGLDVFDKTIHVTNVWLRDIMEEIGPDRQTAWKVLSIVLHKLRDRLPLEVAAHLGAQLPLLIRGVYYDQFRPDDLPADWNNMEELVDDVADWLSDTRPVNPNVAVRAVFRVLSEHVPEGQIEKVRRTLPRRDRRAWEDLEDNWGLEAPPPSRTQAAFPRDRLSRDH